MLFSIAMLNVSGLNDESKWNTILNSVMSMPLQILLLQETHLVSVQEYIFVHCLSAYEIIYEHGTSQSAGVLTAIKRNCGLQDKKAMGCNGCFLSCEVKWNNTKYLICNVYDPNLAKIF